MEDDYGIKKENNAVLPNSQSSQNNRTPDHQDLDFTLIDEKKEKPTGAGLVMLEIDINAILQRRPLTLLEKQTTADIIDYLKTGEYLIDTVKVHACKSNYYDSDHTDFAYRTFYEKSKYFIDENLIHEGNWQNKGNENADGILLNVNGGSGGSSDENNPYCVVSVTFEEGTTAQTHIANLSLNYNTYNHVWFAINHGVNGSIRMYRTETGDDDTYSYLDLLIQGRMKTLSGEVHEGRHFTNSAIEPLNPTSLQNGESITVRMYTEDGMDFDYNDSYVTVVVTNGLNELINESYNPTYSIILNYTDAIKNLTDNAPINQVDVFYKGNATESWQKLKKGINGTEYFVVDAANEKFKIKVDDFTTNSQFKLGKANLESAEETAF